MSNTIVEARENEFITSHMKMQIKTTTSYHFTPIRKAIIKTNKQIKNVGKDVEMLEFLCITGGNVKWRRHWENSMAVPQKVKHRITT